MQPYVRLLPTERLEVVHSDPHPCSGRTETSLRRCPGDLRACMLRALHAEEDCFIILVRTILQTRDDWCSTCTCLRHAVNEHSHSQSVWTLAPTLGRLDEIGCMGRQLYMEPDLHRIDAQPCASVQASCLGPWVAPEFPQLLWARSGLAAFVKLHTDALSPCVCAFALVHSATGGAWQRL